MVTDADEVQVLSVVLLTVMVWEPAATPVKVGEDWYTPASSLYSSVIPVGDATVIVPVATAQVGCTTVNVGTAGGVGCALMVTDAEDVQVLSVVLLTVMVWEPAATPVKIGED